MKITIESLSSVESLRATVRAAIAKNVAQSKSLRADINRLRSKPGSGPERHEIEMSRRFLGSWTRAMLLLLAALRGRSRASQEPSSKQPFCWHWFLARSVDSISLRRKDGSFSALQDALNSARRRMDVWFKNKDERMSREETEELLRQLRVAASCYVLPEKAA